VKLTPSYIPASLVVGVLSAVKLNKKRDQFGSSTPGENASGWLFASSAKREDCVVGRSREVESTQTLEAGGPSLGIRETTYVTWSPASQL